MSEREERRVVTALFADLAGSTALGERLDPEDVRLLQGDLFALVDDEVQRHGGMTEKFVGDAILAVFGIPQAHEDDAERAVRAALAMHDAFEGFSTKVKAVHGADVGLRVGIDTGEVVAGREASARGELMVTGNAVNVAARLQQLADPGEVLVGARTRQVTQRGISYRDRGSWTRRGSPYRCEPGRRWGRRPARERPPWTWPVRGARGRGRDAPPRGEPARARAAAAARDHLRSGWGRQEPARRGVRRRTRRSPSGGGALRTYGDGITYLPLAEVASGLAGIRDDEPAATALEKLETCVAQTVPPESLQRIVEALRWTMGLSLPGRADGTALGGEVGKASHEAWTTYLALLGTQGLLVLVVEDIHRASEALLDLLEEVLSGLEDTAVLVVCPSRPELLETRPSWGTGRFDASSITSRR